MIYFLSYVISHASNKIAQNLVFLIYIINRTHKCAQPLPAAQDATSHDWIVIRGRIRISYRIRIYIL